MAIPVEDLKQLETQFCYGRISGFGEATILFLKKNKDNAYKVIEIVRYLEANKSRYDDLKYTRSGIYNYLLGAVKLKDSKIHKKGSYFWYE